MVDCYVSYFYQIRFFKRWMIPVSTAVWDPKWYHENQNQNHTFVDKRGVLNGVRINPLVPNETCNNLCRGIEACQTKDPNTCAFLSKYYEQLQEIDFRDFMNKLESHLMPLANKLDLPRDPMAIFIVHEVPSKICSERQMLIKWFESNGVPLTELDYPIEDNY